MKPSDSWLLPPELLQPTKPITPAGVKSHTNPAVLHPSRCTSAIVSASLPSSRCWPVPVGARRQASIAMLVPLLLPPRHLRSLVGLVSVFRFGLLVLYLGYIESGRLWFKIRMLCADLIHVRSERSRTTGEACQEKVLRCTRVRLDLAGLAVCDDELVNICSTGRLMVDSASGSAARFYLPLYHSRYFVTSLFLAGSGGAGSAVA